MSASAAAGTVEFFPALSATGVVRHGFIRRIPGIDVATDRAEALNRLDAIHRRIRADLGLREMFFATAEQVHGNEVAVLDRPPTEIRPRDDILVTEMSFTADRCFSGADALVTNQPAVSLGIYVADCCPVFLVDPVARAIGLVHSGRKGTGLAIVPHAIAEMCAHFATQPRDLVVQLGPCIRPPHYEVDFAAEIVRQVRAAGVEQVQDDGYCTACDLAHYYSYRAEKARTGRMLGVLALAP
jgi:YfiH family protein